MLNLTDVPPEKRGRLEVRAAKDLGPALYTSYVVRV